MGALSRGVPKLWGGPQLPVPSKNKRCNVAEVRCPSGYCGWGWGENPAGVGHPTANPPCPHPTVGGDGTVGTCGQSSLGHSLLPHGVCRESPK